MRVSRVQAAKNRQTVINVASRAFFGSRGFDGIGLKDLMKGAGLTTQGAFYKQLASKEDLAAQASRRALESASPGWSAAANPKDPLAAVIAFYLSAEHRQEKMDGCPIVALGSDAARQGSDVKASFEAGIKAHLELLGRLIHEIDGEQPKGKAMAILSTMVGALMLLRVVNDLDLARALLVAAAQQVREVVAA